MNSLEVVVLIVPVVVVVVDVVVDSLTSLYLLLLTSQYSPDLVGLNT